MLLHYYCMKIDALIIFQSSSLVLIYHLRAHFHPGRGLYSDSSFHPENINLVCSNHNTSAHMFDLLTLSAHAREGYSSQFVC